MNMTIKRSGFGWSYLVIGILFIIVALIAFRDPMANLLALAVVFGCMAVISGIWFIVTRFGSTTRLVIGILEILLGILLLVNLGITAAMIPFVFAAWFIADSISNLFLLPYLKPFGKGHYWLMLIISILGIVLGTLMFFEPILSMLTLSFVVGFYFMLVGIGYIIIAFSRPAIEIEIESKKE